LKVLITGANGQVGQALQSLAPENMSLVTLDRSGLDISDLTAVGSILGQVSPDLIINAAAYTSVDRAEREAESAFAANKTGPSNLALVAQKVGARLLHISTDFVFDGRASSPYRPDHPLAPLGVYGQSKADGEAAMQANLPSALIVRTGWVYAAKGSNFLLTMLRLMRERPEVRVVADQIGTPTHADGLARAIWALAVGKHQGILHYSDSGTASWYDFAVAIQEEALAQGLLENAIPIVPIRTQDYPTLAQRPAYSVLDKTDTIGLLGGPSAHWRQELRLALAQLRTQ
jgi:dTDP-4-dehydrorhamnose reductase